MACPLGRAEHRGRLPGVAELHPLLPRPLCPASSRGGFVPVGDSLQLPVEGLARVTFLVQQRPEKTMAQRCPDLRLMPKEWPYGE